MQLFNITHIFYYLIAPLTIALVCLVPRPLSATTPIIDIIGAPQPLTNNIKMHLNTVAESCSLSTTEQQRLLKHINTKIQRAANAIGYYQLTYKHSIQHENDCWKLLISVNPGKPAMVNGIDIMLIGDGKNDSDFNDYLNRLPVKQGDTVNHNIYEKIKTELNNIATNRGYFNAAFVTSKLLVDTEQNTADLIIHYNTGARHRFGEILYPETVLSIDSLHRYNPFETGDYYDTQHLTILQHRLDNSHYFSEVSVQPQFEAIDESRVPVLIKLSALKQHAYQFGVGAATDTGQRIKFSYENRYLNDRGHKLNYELSLSPIRSESNLNYTLPLSNPATEHLVFYTGLLNEETDTSNKDVGTLGVAYTKTLINGWLQSLFLDFQREQFHIAEKTDRTDSLIPGLSLTKTHADDLVYPQNAWRIQTRLRVSVESLMSDVSFVQFHFKAKRIKKLGPGRLLARIDLGATDVGSLNMLPASIRFFAGGDNSVRGYDYEALGPIDTNNKVTGGTHLIAGSLEYDFRLSRSWTIAGFYDQGNAFNSGDIRKLKRGTGIGVRWLSPIGPIRLDFAKALDDNKGIRIHISMGPDL